MFEVCIKGGFRFHDLPLDRFAALCQTVKHYFESQIFITACPSQEYEVFLCRPSRLFLIGKKDTATTICL